MTVNNPGMLALLLLCSSVSAFFPLHQTSEQTANRLSGVEYEATSSNALNKREEMGDAPGIFISISPFTSNTRYRVRSPPRQQKASPVIRDNQYQIVKANAPSQSNSVAIDEDGTDYSYFSTVSVGSKEEKIYMLVDTGSSVTWVMDDSCKSGPCKMHNTFASSQSSSLKTGVGSFNLDYGTGEVSGSYAKDTISFAGMKVTIPIGLADKVSDDFRNYPFDGILGLGRTPLGGSPSVTFIQELANSKQLNANVFGINLQRHADGTADGELNFGSPDSSKYKGDLVWTDTVSDKSFWQIPTDDLLVDGKSVGIKDKRTGILDTGTSYMLIPPNDAKALFGAIKGAQQGDNGYWTIPCDTKAKIEVAIGGTAFQIDPKDYIGSPNKGACTSNIVGMSAAGNDQTWLLGDAFLKNVYTVFDADKNRVGFGAKTGSSKVGGSSSSSSSSSSASSQSTTMATSTGSSSSSASASSSGSSSSSSSNSDSSSTGSSSAKPTGSAGLGLPAVDTKSNATTSPISGSVSTGAPASTNAPVNGARHLVADWKILALGMSVLMLFL